MEELRLRSNSLKYLSINGKMFGKQTVSAFLLLLREFKPVYKDNRFQRIVWLGIINLLSLVILLNWCNTTRSMGLLSYSYLVFFDTLCLCICALSIWVEQKKASPKYTFGYERFEVLAVFISTTLALVGSIFTIKKSIGRWIQQTQIHSGRLFPGIIIAFSCHMLITYCMKNKGLNLVVCASDSSWLQNRISSLNQSLSQIVPGTNEKTSYRINTFSLLGCTAGAILFLAAFAIDIFDYHSADAIAGIFISLSIALTMYPLAAYSGKILLQGTPPHVSDLLDKCLREASTLDGVLEFRNEHFWLLGFDKIIGTLHVRVARDANEQVVLSHLLSKLSSLVADITIQVFKDEWAWSSSSRQILTDSYLKFPPVSEAFSLTTMPNSTASSNIKDTLPLSPQNFPVSFSAKTPEAKQTPSSYSTIPLPPSLSSLQPPTQDISVNMSAVPTKFSAEAAVQAARLQTFNLQSATSTSKYNRELSINPLFHTSPDYGKLYRS